MRFERGKDPKRAMSIGEPPREVYRIWEWKMVDGEAGFFLVQDGGKELQKIIDGKARIGHYSADFWRDNIIGGGYQEELLWKSRGKWLRYKGRLYLMPPEKFSENNPVRKRAGE